MSYGDVALVRHPMQTLLVFNVQGGFHQAELVHGLGEAWAEAGRSVALVDVDPLTRLTDRNAVHGGPTIADVLGARVDPNDALVPLAPRLSLIRGDRLLAGARTWRMQQGWEELIAPLRSTTDLCVCSVPHEAGEALLRTMGRGADAGFLIVEPGSFGLRGVHDALSRFGRALRGEARPVWMNLVGFRPRSPLARNFQLRLRARFHRQLVGRALLEGAEQGPEVRRLASELAHALRTGSRRMVRQTDGQASQSGVLTHAAPSNPIGFLGGRSHSLHPWTP